ncbi:MAG: protein kinase, partial [Planctomycetota bacterium]
MTHLNDKPCPEEKIDSFLSDRLSEEEQADFEAHLSHCDECRDELEQRAADPELWREAVTLLGSAEGSFGGGQSSTDSRFSSGTRALSVLDSLDPTDDPDMLGRIGDYEISGIVGVGGMGAVLKGFDKSLRRVVAIKVMAPHLADSGSARHRFQLEARAAAAITHVNVIDTYGVAESHGLPYLVMPFARGPSLQRRIDESGPMTPIEVVRVGRQIAAGLAAAHEQGLVHRDIKPANILLNEGIERLWITDFGVARAMDDASMTQTGMIAGTPQYMSPEQARGESVDHRSDLFSLGSVLYTACTGRPPFRSEGAYGILRRITDTDPRPILEIAPGVPVWLSRLIERLMNKHPIDRPPSAENV